MKLTEIPRLPTDSLYKFMAIVGIVLFIVSISLPLIFIVPITERTYEIKTEIDVLNIEVNDLVTKTIILLNRLGITVDGSEDITIENYKGIGSIRDLEVDSDEETQEINQIIKLNTQYRKKVAELENRNESHKILVDLYRGTRTTTNILGYLSIALIAVGFYYWHVRLQVYLDKIIKSEAQKLENLSNTAGPKKPRGKTKKTLNIRSK